MKQAIRIFGHGQGFGETAGMYRVIEHYRCSECSLHFEMEQTIDGPRLCPGCGVIYTITAAEQTEQLARLALVLNTDPTTLLWMLRVFTAAFYGIPR